ncbi:MAG: type II site-specific deoxyribonuclease [Parcubacteria group bacterium Gr01-1014_29]|nr:MAG: type II site-specific deoxyribonuclease [Parcubacteria group bacterium Gr01-1014_29]
MDRIKISNKELVRCLIGEIKEFPRYTTQLMNLANQNAQGTRSRVVGQLSELIKECPGKSYQEWIEIRYVCSHFTQNNNRGFQKNG